MGNCMCMPSMAHGTKGAKSSMVVPVGGSSMPQEAERKQVLRRTPPRDSKCSVRYAKDGGGDGSSTEKKKESAAPVRVKVLMSKKEAAQLLSLLAGTPVESIVNETGGAGAGAGDGPFRLAARQDCCAWRPALQSIPENYNC